MKGTRMKKKGLAYLATGGIIAAMYAAVTLLLLPISYHLMQVRVSEALCVLPFFTPAAVPGLFIGCLVANLIGGAPLPDVIFGSLATLLAAVCTYLLGKYWKGSAAKWLAPLPAVLLNALIVGWVLCDVYQVGEPYLVCALFVGAGQAISCYGLGMPLLYALGKFKVTLFREL